MNSEKIIRNPDITEILNIAILAGNKILEVYDKDNLGVQYKRDNSPVTFADKLSQQLIIGELNRISPGIPVISEEMDFIPFEQRKEWRYFWLIDPLDGTKEFIQKNGEFTINIALICQDYPILGVIFAPALNLIYFAEKGKGAFKKDGQGNIISIHTTNGSADRYILLKSRSHSCRQEDEFISYLGNVEEIHTGSSLKFCYLAEGKAQIYLRTGPTMEWDTAAGQCIVECAGGKMLNFEDSAMRYNKYSLRNPGFICTSDNTIILKKIREYFSE